MFIPTINQNDWMALDMDTREAIRAYLDMSKSDGVNVFNGKLVSDGTTYKDLVEKINPENLQKVLKSKESDIYKLFDLLIKKINDKSTEKTAQESADASN